MSLLRAFVEPTVIEKGRVVELCNEDTVSRSELKSRCVARERNSADALFYDTAGDGSDFRLWSQRSITHRWKEMALVGYSQPLDLAPLVERYKRIVAYSMAATCFPA